MVATVNVKNQDRSAIISGNSREGDLPYFLRKGEFENLPEHIEVLVLLKN